MAKIAAVTNEPSRKIKNWMIFFRILYGITVPPWLFLLMLSPMLYDEGVWMTADERDSVRVILLFLGGVPLVSFTLLFLGGYLYKKNRPGWGLVLTAIPVILIYAFILAVLINSYNLYK